jgi:hypothetical protein
LQWICRPVHTRLKVNTKMRIGVIFKYTYEHKIQNKIFFFHIYNCTGYTCAHTQMLCTMCTITNILLHVLHVHVLLATSSTVYTDN